jgi:hypothetical protein
VLDQPRILGHEGVGVVVLHQADRLDPAGDDSDRVVKEDAMRCHCDRLQASAAEAIDGHSGGLHGQARAQHDLARDIRAGRAFGQ